MAKPTCREREETDERFHQRWKRSGWGLLTLPLGLLACGGEDPEAVESARIMALGQQTYLAACATCHQADGAGVPRMNPPMRGSALLEGDAEALVGYVLLGNDSDGMSDWSGVMPAYLEEPLSDEELAASLTYSRAQFTELEDPTVPEALVAELRAALSE